MENWDLIGHEWAVQLLQNHIRNQETRHAYLITGPSGVGRRTLGLRFIQALNCMNPPAPGAFCGECRVCKLVARMQHPDLLVGQADSLGGILKIDTVREIQHGLSFQPYEARWRIALLLRFEEANQNAENALLKTLEEPPEKAKIILTASDENSLLPTVLSRCECIRLRPQSAADLKKVLAEQRQVPDAEAERIAHLSCGSVGYAFSLLESPEKTEKILSVAREGIEIFSQNTRLRFRFAEGYRDVKKRGEVRSILQIWQSLFRDLLLLSVDERALSRTFTDYSLELNAIVRKGSPDVFRKMATRINRAMDYVDANVNLQLLLETLFLDWPVL